MHGRSAMGSWKGAVDSHIKETTCGNKSHLHEKKKKNVRGKNQGDETRGKCLLDEGKKDTSLREGKERGRREKMRRKGWWGRDRI